MEGAPGSGKTALSLRLLHSWATQNSWWGPTISIALFVPLRELRGRSISQYLCRELLPRSAAADLPQLWQRFSALEDRLLFVLDGYDEAIGPTSSGTSRLSEDANDLLCGRLFPECRLVVTSCPEFGDRLAPFVQRKVRLLGREWNQVERFVNVHFGSPRAEKLLKAISDNRDVLRPLAQAPLGWLSLCLLYEECSPQDFPKDLLRVYESLTQCLTRKRMLRITGGLSIPVLTDKVLAEFGKLALDCIKSNVRYSYTEIEVRGVKKRSGGIEISCLGMLNKSATFGRRARTKNKDHVYTLIHPSFAEYLAARYVMREASRGGPVALRKELESLPGVGRSRQLNQSTVLIIRFLMGMLASRGHLILDLLCPLDLSVSVVLLLLKEAGAHRNNVTAVCRLLGGRNIPGDGGEWPRIHTTPAELEGWTYVLLSGHCTLDRLELVYQLGNLESAYLEMFFKALSFNDSVRMVKISSLLDEWSDVEGLAANVSTALAKQRLASFELVVTCLQEDTPERTSRFQIVVNEICSRLSTRTTRLDRLALDLSLSSNQVQQLCRALEKGKGTASLHLPHLCLDTDTASSVSKLVLSRPLAALNVTGSWSAITHEDVPSSSGVSSMGSGSKLSPNGCPPSPPHAFSSLPRGTIGMHSGVSRPATLPRQPLLEQSVEGCKRLSDSLVWQRHFHYPGCSETGVGGCSHQHGFHKIFEAVRDARCVLDHLNVSRCVFLGGEDAACLGESVRRSRTLHSLRMEGFTRFTEVIPVVLALAENSSLQLLDLGSSRITLEDSQTQLVCKSLARNITLRTLNVDGWTYRLEETGTLKQAITLVASTKLVELVLDNGRIHLASGDIPFLGNNKSNTNLPVITVPTFKNDALRHIRMAGLQVTLNDRPALYGPTLLPYLVGFTAVAHLDLSSDKTIANTVDDANLMEFFATLSKHFRSLKVLIANNWCLKLERYEKTFRSIRKSLENCTFTVLKLHSLTATTQNTAKRTPIEHVFLRSILHGLCVLGTLDISGMVLTKKQAEHLAFSLRSRPNSNAGRSIDLHVEGMNSDVIRTLVNEVQVNSKLQVTYLGGLSCVVRVHQVREKTKEQNQQILLAI